MNDKPVTNIFSAEIPSYFPDGYFWAKAVFSDFLLLEDRFKFTKHGPAHRVKLGVSDEYLTIPCRFGGVQRQICEVEPAEQNWQKKHWGTVISRYAHLPNFAYLAPELEPLFAEEYKTVAEFHFRFITYIKYLWRLPVTIKNASSLFDKNLPRYYIKQWEEIFSFSFYLLTENEIPYLKPQLDMLDSQKLILRTDDSQFAREMKKDTLSLLFRYGTDLPGLLKRKFSATAAKL